MTQRHVGEVEQAIDTLNARKAAVLGEYRREMALPGAAARDVASLGRRGRGAIDRARPPQGGPEKPAMR